MRMIWRVYGEDGHRQRESFSNSYHYDFSRPADVRKITVLNSDVTQTNEYSIVIIERNTKAECIKEFDGQLSDGIFENSKVGRIDVVGELKTEFA